MNLTNDDVQEIVRLLDASPFDELRLETARFKLVLRRSAAGEDGWTQETRTAARTPAVAAAAASIAANVAPPASATRTADGSIAVCTPIVGTFYRSPKPGAPPFVEVGAAVGADSVVGIVETMKLMNSVYAGVRGEVTEICVADGQFVDSDQVLIRLRPAGP